MSAIETFSTSREAAKTRIFLYAGFVLIGTVNTFLGPILPLLSEKWTINDTQGGYFLAAQSLGGMFGTFASSFLYGRADSRKILLIGFGLLVISVFGIGGGTWEIGLFSSLINGIGIGFVIPATTLIISRTAAEKRASAINLLNFFWALGAILSPLIFLRISSAAQLNYILTAIAAVGAVFFILAFRQSAYRLIEEKKESLLSGGEKIRAFFVNWIFAATIFLQIGIEVSMSGWLPSYANRFGSSELWLTAPFAYWTGFLLSRLISSFVLKNLTERKLILSGLLLSAVGLFIVVSTREIYLISFGALLAGFGAAPIFPTTIALASAKYEKKSPEMINYLFFLAGLSGMFFLWLIGFVSAAFESLQIALYVPAVCVLVLLALNLLDRRTDTEN